MHVVYFQMYKTKQALPDSTSQATEESDGQGDSSAASALGKSRDSTDNEAQPSRELTKEEKGEAANYESGFGRVVREAQVGSTMLIQEGDNDLADASYYEVMSYIHNKEWQQMTAMAEETSPGKGRQKCAATSTMLYGRSIYPERPVRQGGGQREGNV